MLILVEQGLKLVPMFGILLNRHAHVWNPVEQTLKANVLYFTKVEFELKLKT